MFLPIIHGSNMKYKSEYDNFGGEMLPFERRFLYKYIVLNKPSIVFELGSGSGGSTRIILSALNDLNCGLLYNCDPINNSVTQIADVNTKRMYFYHTYSYVMIDELVQQNIIPDFVFFDGPEDAETALNDFNVLNPLLKNGAAFVMHDWELRKRIDGNYSIKASQMHNKLSELFKLRQWVMVEQLSGVNDEYPNDTGYNSIGMICAIKVI